ncbi:MAG: peptidylprolyl isomerase [Gemmataceae bacterium]|nr:peptidylprolyl isomerase [Gemmataceae bacterium]
MPQRMQGWLGCGIGVISAASVLLAGCKKAEDNPDASKQVVQVEAKKDNQGKTIPAQPVGLAKGLKLLSFQEAVILSDNPPEDELRPPNKTHTGKNAVKIFETIANDLWAKTTFTNDDGKRIKYQAVIATEIGDVQLVLNGEAAHNHVRSFVCLAKTGYYDGMAFYYSLNRVVEDNTIAFIEAGCPRGTGEAGSGSIGYWLRPEISEKLSHEEGVIGACIGRDPNSAACRFYITAAPNSFMDREYTIFGKVTRGLDVVRTINKREVLEEGRLKAPVLIKSVTIQTILE